MKFPRITKNKETQTNLPVIKSHSGRYTMIMEKHSNNKKKGIWGSSGPSHFLPSSPQSSVAIPSGDQ